MAISRHSQIFQAKDYVKPFDLSVYSSLINERQRVFDTNLKTLSGSLAKYTSLPIYRPIDKEYVAGKISNLSNQINDLNATDYSDPAVFSQINSMISTIGDDQRIKNALLSSAGFDRDNKEIEQSKKDKTYQLANAYEVQSAQSAYINSTDENIVYQSPGYKAYKQDGFKNVIDVMSKMKKEGSATVETIDVNGNRVPATYTWEGLKPEDVRRIATSLTSADDYDQLYRDAQYVYRGITNKPTDAYSRDWIVKANKHFLSSQIGANKQLINELSITRENIMASNDPNKNEQLSKVEAGIRAQQANLQTIQSQLNDEDYLYNTGVEKLYDLKNKVYLEDRYNALGDLLGYNINNIKVGSAGKGGASHGAETFLNENGEFSSPIFYEPVVEDNSDIGHTKNYILGQLNKIQTQIGFNGQPGALTLDVLDKMVAADPMKASLPKDALMSVYKQKEQMFNQGKLTNPEDEYLRKHFVQLSDLRSQQAVIGELQMQAQAELQANPLYVMGKRGLDASLKNDLKDFYDIEVQTDYGRTEKKRFSKDAIVNYMLATEQIGSQAGKPLKPSPGIQDFFATAAGGNIVGSYFNQPIMDVNKPLPRQNGDNSLIDAVNKGMSNFKMTEEQAKSFNRSIPGALGYYAKEAQDFLLSPFRPWGAGLAGPSFEYVDPLASLEESDMGMQKHLALRKEFAGVVKDAEDKAYEKLGYVSMVPTFTPSQDNKVQNELIGTAQGIVTSYETNDDAKQRSVESVRGLRLYPDGQIGITYSYKDGDKVASAVVKVPRNQAGTFAQYMPEDEYIVYQNSIDKIKSGGTSTDVSKAPKAVYGSTILPYRIYKAPGGYGMQIFQNGKLDTRPNPQLVFPSVKSLVRNAQLIAQKMDADRRGIKL